MESPPPPRTARVTYFLPMRRLRPRNPPSLTWDEGNPKNPKVRSSCSGRPARQERGLTNDDGSYCLRGKTAVWDTSLNTLPLFLGNSRNWLFRPLVISVAYTPGSHGDPELLVGYNEHRVGITDDMDVTCHEATPLLQNPRPRLLPTSRSLRGRWPCTHNLNKA